MTMKEEYFRNCKGNLQLLGRSGRWFFLSIYMYFLSLLNVFYHISVKSLHFFLLVRVVSTVMPLCVQYIQYYWISLLFELQVRYWLALTMQVKLWIVWEVRKKLSLEKRILFGESEPVAKTGWKKPEMI